MDQRTYGIDGTSALKLAKTRDFWVMDARKPTRTRPCADESVTRVRLDETELHNLFTITACALLVAIALLCMAVSGLTSWRVSNAIGDRGVEVVLVQPGDTLWSIATRRAVEGCSTPELVQWIKAQNDLSDARIFAGQTLTAPVMRPRE